MTTPNKILVELLDVPSTADAAASHVGVPMLVAKAMLQRMETDGLTTAVPAGELTLWKLTPAGWETATALKNQLATATA
jgi:hypothetical protein